MAWRSDAALKRIITFFSLLRAQADLKVPISVFLSLQVTLNYQLLFLQLKAF